MQRNKISFKGQRIYIGIDVHKANWEVFCLTESGANTRHSQKPSAKELATYLHRRFPDAEYCAVYESGFTGFSTYYALEEVDINCMVVNAADVPTTQYQTIMKTDKVDSEKLARALKAGLLNPIYVYPRQYLDDRSVIRIRKRTQEDLTRYKARIKLHLYSNGVEIPERFSKSSQWTKEYIKWLRNDVCLLSESRISLDLLISQLEKCMESLKECNRKLIEMSRCNRYSTRFNLLCSIPGIGTKVAMCILTEIQDFNRFNNERQFASYIGLVPMRHSSGSKNPDCEMTFRGNKQIATMLIGASWVSIYRDIELSAAYRTYCQRMKRQDAIIRIARKLSNRIFAVMKTNKKYEPA